MEIKNYKDELKGKLDDLFTYVNNEQLNEFNEIVGGCLDKLRDFEKKIKNH